MQRKGKDLNTPLVRKKDIDPCPFCGIKKRPCVVSQWRTSVSAVPYFVVRCTGVKCKAKGPEKTTQAAAIISWNNRAADNGDERIRLSFARDGM